MTRFYETPHDADTGWKKDQCQHPEGHWLLPSYWACTVCDSKPKVEADDWTTLWPLGCRLLSSNGQRVVVVAHEPEALRVRWVGMHWTISRQSIEARWQRVFKPGMLVRTKQLNHVFILQQETPADGRAAWLDGYGFSYSEDELEPVVSP